jgi:glucosamine 6-phosphate synthetase-like amidotransferase/phosphosugar isomerase protein
MISNYSEVMRRNGFPWVGEVDSQVIFHLMGRDAFLKEDLRQLNGSIALAAVDTADPTIIRLARTVQRPLWIAQTPTGSVLWASELPALEDAMKCVGLKADFVMEVPEWTMVTVNNGRIEAVESIHPIVAPRRQNNGSSLLTLMDKKFGIVG